MPRYRYGWKNLPTPLLRALAAGLEITGDPTEGLARQYGVRPRIDFIQQAWPILLDSWLPKEASARRDLVDTLQGCRLGRTDISVRSKNGQLEYLRSCRNAPTLRQAVLPLFVEFGETRQITTRAAAPVTAEEPNRGALSAPEITPRPAGDKLPIDDRAPDLTAGPDRFNAWVQATLAEMLGADELYIDDDGDIPIPRGSAVVFVRPLPADGSFLNLMSPLLTDFGGTPTVHEAVNALNQQIPLAKALVVGDGSQIIMTADLLADGLTRAGVLYAVDLMTDMADHFDTLLQQRFGGTLMGRDEQSIIDV